MELGNHSEFLDVMESSEMLTRWFINDTAHAGTYRLKGHSINDFWDWVNSWASCIEKPSDIGFSDDGYILPQLIKHKVIVDGDIFSDTNGMLFRIPDVNATTLHKEKRKSLVNRVKKVKEILDANKSDNFIIWCDTDYESDELLSQLWEYKDEMVEVRGSEKQSTKEEKLTDFTAGQKRIIVTKPRIGGLGLNWQHCHNMIFVGIGFSFEYYYQCIKRVHRFGQKNGVNVYLIMGENESTIYSVLIKKEQQFEQMKHEMFESCVRNYARKSEVKVMYEANHKDKFSLFGRQNLPVNVLAASKSDKFEIFHSDCIEFLKQTPDNWVDFSIYSPPFAQLYIYSDSIADMGNCSSDEEFFKQYEFLIKEKLRCTRPGRLTAVHCKDLVYYQNSSDRGDAGIRDFSGQIIEAHLHAGWTYHSRITIWKCPVIERGRSNPQGLLYKTLRTQADKCRQGMAEYLLIFRKWGGDENDYLPVEHAAGTPNEVPLSIWQKWASPVWLDVKQTKVLNVAEAKDGRDEKHICPLQLDVIERSVKMWSNPGEVVFSPFMGIGSEGHEAIRAGRKFIGTELKDTYFQKSIKNLSDVSNQAVDMFAYAEDRDIGEFGAGKLGKTG
jgi:DNA modification methylase